MRPRRMALEGYFPLSKLKSIIISLLLVLCVADNLLICCASSSASAISNVAKVKQQNSTETENVPLVSNQRKVLQHTNNNKSSPTINQNDNNSTRTESRTKQLVAILSSKPRKSSVQLGHVDATNLQVAATSNEQIKQLDTLNKPNPDNNYNNNTKTTTNIKKVKIQSKRQIFGGDNSGGAGNQLSSVSDQSSGQTQTSGRNGDPWFLDQAPLPLQPYRFNYNVKGQNGLTEQYRQEVGDGKYLTGSYGYVLPDGIYRHVDYIADERGFRAFIRTSEPGTANQNPADVVINSTPPYLYSPGVSYARDLGDGNYVPSPLLSPAQPTVTNPGGINDNLNSTTTGGGGGLQLADFNFARQQILANNALRQNLIQKPTGSGGDSSGEPLVRRPPGSIVNTSLPPLPPLSRNFTSYSYQPNSAYSSVNSLVPIQDIQAVHFDSLRKPIGNNWPPQQQQQVVSSIKGIDDGGGGVSGWQRANLLNNTLAGGERGLKSDNDIYQWRQQQSSAIANNDSATRRPIPYLQPLGFQSNNLGQIKSIGGGANNLWLPTNAGNYVPRPVVATARFGPWSTPVRAGPDVLVYDRQFANQQHFNGKILPYNNDYIVHQQTGQLALERAKNIAQLEHLNTLNRLAGTSSPSAPTQSNLGHYPSLFSLPSVKPLNPLPITTTYSSYKSEHHHQQQEHQSNKQFVDTVNKISISKEHKSGSISGFGREQHQQQQHDNDDSRTTKSQPLPLIPLHVGQSTKGGGQHKQQQQHQNEEFTIQLVPPPEPQFNTQRQLSSDTKGGGGSSGRLRAPYVQQQQQSLDEQYGQNQENQNSIHQQQQQQLTTKGGSEQQNDEHDRSIASVQPPQVREPTSPQEPQEPRSPVTLVSSSSLSPPNTVNNDLQQQQQQSSSSTNYKTTTTIMPAQESSAATDEHQQRVTTTTSSTTTTKDPLDSQNQLANTKQQVFRSIRMPQDYRTSMMMNDLRSMQNAIGLPQPPRMIGSESNSNTNLQNVANTERTDHFLSSRLNKTNTLHLRSPGLPIAKISSGAHQLQKQQQQSGNQQVNRAKIVATAHDLVDQLIEKSKQQQKQHINAELSRGRNEKEGDIKQVANDLTTINSKRTQQQQIVGPLSEFNQNDHHKEFNLIPLSASEQTFEAQRLVNKTNRLGQLRVDKVSELEKFQRRLKSQQLLLEQLKSEGNQMIGNSGSKPSIGISNLPQQLLLPHQHRPTKNATPLPVQSSNEAAANSHVKYDDPPESTGGDLHASKLQNHKQRLQAAEIARTRRQNDEQTTVRNASSTTTTTPSPIVSDFARQIQKWPSLSELGKVIIGGIVATTTANQTDKNNAISKLEVPSAKQTFVELPINGKINLVDQNQSKINNISTTTTTTTTTTTSRPKLPNTINLDFINSVTALSVDQLNPFAISSVNPAINSIISMPNNGIGPTTFSNGKNNSERLSPYKLSLITSNGILSQHQQPNILNSPITTSGASEGSSSQFFHTANELVDSIGEQANKFDSIGKQQHHNNNNNFSAQHLPANHQPNNNLLLAQHVDIAPYMLHTMSSLQDDSPKPVMVTSDLENNNHNYRNPLAARFIVGPTTAATSNNLFEAAANSQHKSFAIMPASSDARRVGGEGGKRQTRTVIEDDNNKKKQNSGSSDRKKLVIHSEQQHVPLVETTNTNGQPLFKKTLFAHRQHRHETDQLNSGTNRDGFEVRDRAMHLDNHRFIEVVTSAATGEEAIKPFGRGTNGHLLPTNSEFNNNNNEEKFNAFLDPQLSIPATS